MTRPLIYLLNGNSNAGLTRHLASVAASVNNGRVEIETDTVTDAPRYIGDRRDVVRASAHILDRVESRFAETRRPRPDAVILACFGEPGFEALREAVDVPVYGLLETSARLAAENGGKFSILTPGENWPRLLAELLVAYGLWEHCRGISQYSKDALDPDDAVWRPAMQGDCDRTAERERPDSIIIGGALCAGRANGLIPPRGTRLVDAFEATVICAISAAVPAAADDPT